MQAGLIGNTEQAAKAFRRVRVAPIAEEIAEGDAKLVKLSASRNLVTVPGNFDRGRAQLGFADRGRSVELTGTLAFVAEYGMLGRGWQVPAGRSGRTFRISGASVPPPRATMGRPGPEDGWVIGLAWRLLRTQAQKLNADQMLGDYMVQVDKGAGSWSGKVAI